MIANIFSYFGKALQNKKVVILDEESPLLELDAAISEDHKASSQATVHEIEDGSEISDHVIDKGIILNISGIISDDPINLVSTMIGTASGITGSLIGGKAGAIATGVLGKIGNTILQNANGKPSKSAHDIMMTIKEDKILCSIVTGLSTYTNMILEDYSVPRSAETQRSLRFSASFRQVKIVSSETVLIPASKKESGLPADSDTSRGNLGKQNSDNANTAIQGKGESWLYNMTH